MLSNPNGFRWDGRPGHYEVCYLTWVHCNDFRTPAGDPVADTFIDGVSVIVPRFGRDVGPSTPLLARIEGEDFHSTSPLRVLANRSRFSLTEWRFEAVGGSRKLVGEVDADCHGLAGDADCHGLAGVTYHDADGELAFCYNGEACSMRLHLYERSTRSRSWIHRRTLVAPGHAHFEYAQRTPLPDLELLTR
jgi:hypothetical protein